LFAAHFGELDRFQRVSVLSQPALGRVGDFVVLWPRGL
jgi:hypothetical protein